MDLSGHDAFHRDRSARHADARLGEVLLSAGWAALASARAEALEVRLRSGAHISGIIALRVNGAMAEASTARGLWTHYFAVADVALVQVVPRGGQRGA